MKQQAAELEKAADTISPLTGFGAISNVQSTLNQKLHTISSFKKPRNSCHPATLDVRSETPIIARFDYESSRVIGVPKGIRNNKSMIKSFSPRGIEEAQSNRVYQTDSFAKNHDTTPRRLRLF